LVVFLQYILMSGGDEMQLHDPAGVFEWLVLAMELEDGSIQ